MKYSTKIIVCYVCIIFITSGFFVYHKNQEYEARKPPPIKEGMDDLGKSISNAILGPIQPLIDIGNEISQFFQSIPGRFQHLTDGFADIGKALELQFVNLGLSLKTVFVDIWDFISLIRLVFPFLGTFFTQYLGPRIMCGIVKIENLSYCMLFYVMEAIGQAIYTVVVRLPVWIVKISPLNTDLNPYIDSIWDIAYCLDSFIYGAVGFHVLRWSDNVMDKCFECRGLQPMPEFPTQPFKDQIHKIHTDYNTADHDKTIPSLLNAPYGLFKQAGSDFVAVFN